MQFTVIIPDSADPKVIDSLSQAVHAAGGTVMPDDAGGPESMPGAGANPLLGAGPPGAPPGGPPGGPPHGPPGGAPGGMPPLDMSALLQAGPGAGMKPGAAMAAKGARALRPRPGQ